MDSIKPDYYKINDGEDLFDLFEKGLMTVEQVRGFYIGNNYKYMKRYRMKNGIQDLKKAHEYEERLLQFEEKLKNDKANSPIAGPGAPVADQKDVG